MTARENAKNNVTFQHYTLFLGEVVGLRTIETYKSKHFLIIEDDISAAFQEILISNLRLFERFVHEKLFII